MNDAFCEFHFQYLCGRYDGSMNGIPAVNESMDKDQAEFS